MATFTNQIKGYNKQFAAGYIVYMMGSSYFQDCKCNNKHEEKHLFLHYAEMPKQTQMTTEDNILRILDKLDKNFLTQMSELKSEVHFSKKGSDYYIKFLTGGFGSLTCKVKENGEMEVIKMR